MDLVKPNNVIHVLLIMLDAAATTPEGIMKALFLLARLFTAAAGMADTLKPVTIRIMRCPLIPSDSQRSSEMLRGDVNGICISRIGCRRLVDDFISRVYNSCYLVSREKGLKDVEITFL